MAVIRKILARLHHPKQLSNLSPEKNIAEEPFEMSKSESHCPPGGELGAKVAAQGDLVRQLKADKKNKEEIDSAVKALLALKVSTIQNCQPQE